MDQAFHAAQRDAFAANYNRSSFMFDHRLDGDTVFALDSLAALAGRLPEPDVYCSLGQAAVGGGWDQGRQARPSASDIVRSIGDVDALVMLKNVDRDAELGPVFRAIVDALVDQVGPALRDDACHGRATLLIGAPNRVTAYHIDAEVNYLLQIRGEKLLRVFDGNDRTLLSDAELEAFYRGDYNSARWRDDRDGEAALYTLCPGKGVHVPIHAPHWVANGPNVSVSMSVNFDLRSHARAEALYRINGKLRRLGLRPSPPGRSPLGDRVKVALSDGAAYARRLRRGGRAGTAAP